MLIRPRALFALAFAVLLVVACGGSNADFSGVYSVTVTNGTNDCQFPNWTAGSSTNNISVTITQDPTNLSVAQITFNDVLLQLYLDAVLGTHVFTGAKVNGEQLDVTVLGTKTATQGACGYTVNAHLQLTLTGNTINGTIAYTPVTNGDASCGALNSCSSSQTISGARPAK